MKKNYWLSIDKDEQKLYVMKGNDSIEEMLCSTGTEIRSNGYDCKTREGRFKITSIENSSDYIWEPQPYRRPYGPWLFDIISLDKDVSNAIHGTDEPEKLGRKASHGCIRVSNENITKLKEKYVMRGTHVIVRSGEDEV